LLTAMLNKAGFAADPVMLSTRSHGYTNELYPLMSKFNKIISRLYLNGDYVFLDASQPRLGFGKLGYESYNGHARVINPTATYINIVGDYIGEGKGARVFNINDDKKKLLGTLQLIPRIYESCEIRRNIKESGKVILNAYIK